MPTIPAALLKQLYQRGSLRNSESGYGFTLRNHLAPAHIIGLHLEVDGAAVGAEQISIDQSGAAQAAGAINADNPLRFAPGSDTRVLVAGGPLAPGKHELKITAETREIGAVVIAVSDQIGAQG